MVKAPGPRNGGVSPGKLPAAARSQDGFTLIEMLVAMIVIAILAAILVPDLFGSKGSSQDTRAKAAVDAAKAAAIQYYTANNSSFNSITAAKLEALLPTLHETKPPAGTENATGSGHDPLAVDVASNWNGEVLVLCSIPDKGTAVFCVRMQPEGYKLTVPAEEAATYYSEGRTSAMTINEIVEDKGTTSYGGNWNKEGW